MPASGKQLRARLWSDRIAVSAPLAPVTALPPAPSGEPRPQGRGSRRPRSAGQSAAYPGCRAQTREVTGGILALSSSQGCRFCSANSDELCRHSGSGWIDSFSDFWKASCCSCSINRLACCRSASRSSAVCRLPGDTLSLRPDTGHAPPGTPPGAAGPKPGLGSQGQGRAAGASFWDQAPPGGRPPLDHQRRECGRRKEPGNPPFPSNPVSKYSSLFSQHSPDFFFPNYFPVSSNNSPLFQIIPRF